MCRSPSIQQDCGELGEVFEGRRLGVSWFTHHSRSNESPKRNVAKLRYVLSPFICISRIASDLKYLFREAESTLKVRSVLSSLTHLQIAHRVATQRYSRVCALWCELHVKLPRPFVLRLPVRPRFSYFTRINISRRGPGSCGFTILNLENNWKNRLQIADF